MHKILFAMERQSFEWCNVMYNDEPSWCRSLLSTYDITEIRRHLRLLDDAGLVKHSDTKTYRITNAGYDLLDELRFGTNKNEN